MRSSGVFRSDDFVDIPLHSPASAKALRVKGAAAEAQQGEELGTMPCYKLLLLCYTLVLLVSQAFSKRL